MVLMFLVIVVMVMSAATLFMVMVVMMVLMFLMIVVMMMFMLFVIMVVMMMSMLVNMSAFRANFFFHHFLLQRYRMFHNFQDLCTFQFLDRCGDDCCLRVDLTKKLHCSLCFCFIYDIGTAHDDRTCIFNLVIEKFTKVSHIHFAFLCIYNSCVAVKNQSCLFCNTLNCFDNI